MHFIVVQAICPGVEKILGEEQGLYASGQDGVPWLSLPASWTLRGVLGRKVGAMGILCGSELGT